MEHLIKLLLYFLCVLLSITINVVIMIKNKKKITLTSILEMIPKYMEQAEKQFNTVCNPAMKKTGSQKLSFVQDKIKIDCLSSGVKYNEDKVNEKVEEFINLTKNVNSK